MSAGTPNLQAGTPSAATAGETSAAPSESTTDEPGRPDLRIPPPSIARSSLAMASGTVASRVLGIVRQSLIVSVVGLALAGDAFGAANVLPNVIYQIIAGGVLNSVLIPQLVKARAHEDGGREFTDRILTLGGSAILLVTLVCTAAAPLLVRALTHLPDSALRLAVLFAYITVPQIFFYGLYALLGQVLNARGQFAAFGWSPAIANVVAIAGLVSFLFLFPSQSAPGAWTGSMIWWLGGTATASIAVQGLVLLIPLYRKGFRFTPRFGFRDAGLSQTTRVARWAFAALAVSQLGFVIASRVMTTASSTQTAALFVAGLAVYQSALLVFTMPHSFVALSVITAMYPRISRAAHEGDKESLRSDYARGLTVPTALTLPASVVLLTYALPISTLLFDSHSGATALVLACMALGVVPFSIDVLNQRFFYAHDDGRMAFAEQLVLTGSATVVNIAALYVVPPRLVVPAVGVGLVVSNVLSALFGMVVLRRRIGRLGLGAVVRSYVRIAVASAIAGGIGWLIALGFHPLVHGRAGALLTLVVGSAVFTLVYFLLAALLHIEEVGELVDPVVRGSARAARSLLRRSRGSHGSAVDAPPPPGSR